jgi:hypothetical protein
MAPPRRYERPDGAVGVANLSLALTVWSTGEVTASLASWAAGERIRHYRLPNLHPDASVAPAGLEALALAGDAALEMWANGELR